MSRWICLSVVAITCYSGPMILAGPYFGKVTGHVYEDGVPIIGDNVYLFLDDGNGEFDPDGSDVFVDQTFTSAGGEYEFDDLDLLSGYFATNAGNVSDALYPGAIKSIIDSFDDNQVVSANNGNNFNSSHSANPIGVLGLQRDVAATWKSGNGTTVFSSNQPGAASLAELKKSANSSGRIVVNWDGIDADSGETPAMGLDGFDLTQANQQDAFRFDLGFNTTGERLTVRIFSTIALNSSSASFDVPVTADHLTTAFVPFSDFVGFVSPSHVDAVQLLFDSNSTSAIDGQIDKISLVGPATYDFVSTSVVPEPKLTAYGFLFLLLAQRRIVANRRSGDC